MTRREHDRDPGSGDGKRTGTDTGTGTGTDTGTDTGTGTGGRRRGSTTAWRRLAHRPWLAALTGATVLVAGGVVLVVTKAESFDLTTAAAPANGVHVSGRPAGRRPSGQRAGSGQAAGYPSNAGQSDPAGGLDQLPEPDAVDSPTAGGSPSPSSSAGTPVRAGQPDQPSLVTGPNAAARRAGTGAASAGPADGGSDQIVQLRDFTGIDDRTRLIAAIDYTTAQPVPPTILLPPDTRIDVSAGPITLRNGLRLRGQWTGAREFLRTVVVTGTGPLFELQQGPGVQTRDVTFEGISFGGPSTVDFMKPEDLGRGPVLAYSRFRDVAFNGFHTVMWSRMLGVIVDGDSYTNNSVATPWYLSGSDNVLWPEGGFVDSPHLADTDYLIRFGNMSKSTVGPVFVTGDGPTPLRVDGGRDLVVTGLKAESQGNPRHTAGSGILITGGMVTLRDVWVYGVLNNVAALSGRGDRGMITVLGGDVLVDGAVFGRPDTGPPDGTPVVFAAGSSHVIVAHARGEQRTLKYGHSGAAKLTVQ